MLRKTLIAFMVLSLGVLPVLAADNWYVFVFNGLSGQLVRIDATGSQTTFDLALPENSFVSGSAMALSADGNRIAYCPNTPGTESAQGTSTLIVRDLAANANVLEIPLGPSIGCQVSDQSLSGDGTQVAVSLVRYFPGDTNTDTSNPMWHVTIYDINSGSVIHELSADSSEVAAAGVIMGTALMPDVRYFANNQIIFAEVPWGIGGSPEWRAFTWDLNSSTLTLDETGRWGKSGLSAQSTTGELVWLDSDPALAASDPGGPIPAFNIVRLADKTGQERAIYHNGERILIDTAFINGGAQLGLTWMTPFDIDNPEQQMTSWVALERDGSVTPLGEGAAYVRMVDGPGGAAIFQLHVDETAFAQSFALDYLANGATTRLWEAADMGWELVGATPAPVAGNLSAFPAIG